MNLSPTSPVLPSYVESVSNISATAVLPSILTYVDMFSLHNTLVTNTCVLPSAVKLSMSSMFSPLLPAGIWNISNGNSR